MFIIELETAINANKNDENAFQMAKYMKNNFNFSGIKSPILKSISIPLIQKYKTQNYEEIQKTALELWEKEEREYQYVAMEYLKRNKAFKFEESINLFETLILSKSWWDSVDLIASHLIGGYFLTFPEKIEDFVENALQNDSFWMRRTAIIFQLQYKNQTRIDLMEKAIFYCSNEKEFFIRKAIGWILRQYSYTNPNYVIEFVKTHNLSKLSQKEALKVIERKKIMPNF